MTHAAATPPGARDPVVSSAHLAEGGSPALSEIEFGLILAGHAFHRWMVRCAAAASGSALSPPGLSAMEVLILHTVCHRDRPKRLSDIALVLDIEDLHLVTYALRKLTRAGLVATERAGKERHVRATTAGREFCARYGAIRERLLVAGFAGTLPEAALSDLAALLRTLSGYYNQAARAAATL